MKKLLSSVSVAVLAGAACVLSVQAQANDGDVEIHGFASQGYIKTTEENLYPVGNSGEGSFNFNDFGINFTKRLTPDLRVGLQLFAQDRGNFGNDNITLDWAYGDYRYQDWLGVRVGKVKIPLGLYNESRDNDALRNPILLPQGLYSDYFRDVTNSILGAGIYGTAPRTSAGKFSYQFYVGTLPLNNDSALAGALAASAMSSGPTYNYGLEWQPPVDGLRFAVTGLSTEWATTFGNPAAPTNLTIEPFQRQIFSVEYVRDSLTLNAEYGLEDLDFDWGFGGPIQKRQGDSWYIGSAYRFTDWMELGAYYNEYYQDRNHRDGSSAAVFGVPNDFNMYQKDFAVTVRFDPMRDVVVKFEGHLLKGTALNWLDFTPADMVKDWTLFAAKVTYNF